MMKASAVICECNPFHFGHEYIFANAKKTSDCVVAVMSGNFVQRAENAIFDKYARAKALCRCGADLVVELPFPWSSASAEYFASAGVRVADALRADTLVFGASRMDTNVFKAIAKFVESDPESLLACQQTKITQGAAGNREEYLVQQFGEAIRESLRAPNDILAIEYYRAILRQHSSMGVQAFPRISQAENNHFRSATLLRQCIYEQSLASAAPFIPSAAYDIFSSEWDAGHYAEYAKLSDLLFTHFRLNHAAERITAEGADGVLARLRNCAETAGNSREMFAAAATKKYTNARFRRAALYSLLDVSAEQLHRRPEFTMVLAANAKGCAYLSQIRRTAEIPILTKPSDGDTLSSQAAHQYQKLCEADRVYTLCMNQIPASGYFMKKTPWIDKESFSE